MAFLWQRMAYGGQTTKNSPTAVTPAQARASILSGLLYTSFGMAVRTRAISLSARSQRKYKGAQDQWADSRRMQVHCSGLTLIWRWPPCFWMVVRQYSNLLFFFLFKKNFFIVVHLQLSQFSPCCSPSPHPPLNLYFLILEMILTSYLARCHLVHISPRPQSLSFSDPPGTITSQFVVKLLLSVCITGLNKHRSLLCQPVY